MEPLKHNCGVALIRLLKPLSFYERKYGTSRYGLEKLYLMMEKQHNRGQEGAGLAYVDLEAEVGTEYMFRERAEGPDAITEIFKRVETPAHAQLFMGHLRYSTTGKSGLTYVHPYLRRREVREYLAEMGFTKLSDIIGRTELLVRKPGVPGSKASYIDLSRLLFREDGSSCWAGGPLHELPAVRDQEIIKAAQPAIDWKEEISLEYPIANTDRAVCTMLSGRIAAKYGAEGLPDSTVNIKFKGSAGQSFCAFLAGGVNVRLEGEANDYVGKGLSGGRVAIRPSTRATFKAEENTIAGNTCLYGATGGEMYVAGRVGQRFAVRNSGAKAVVEGAGDHCCEYMTGGRVVVLGPVGRNFAAGMSGGVAYIYDPGHVFDYYCNLDMVEISLVDDKLDRKELHELVRQHYLYTGSNQARTLLDDWNRSLDDFVKVIPIEYKHVLEQERLRALAEKVQNLQIQY